MYYSSKVQECLMNFNPNTDHRYHSFGQRAVAVNVPMG